VGAQAFILPGKERPVIARVADHCFWFGRYIERVDSMTRVLHVTLHLSLDAEFSGRQCWLPVLVVSGEKLRFTELHGEAASGDGEKLQRYLALDEKNPVSIVSTIAAARENARTIREVISLEVWETINELYLWSQSTAAHEEYATNRYGFYRQVRHAIELCRGLLQSTLLHDDPLGFIELGIMLERAGQTARIVDVHHHVLSLDSSRMEVVVETGLWLSILRSCSGWEPYMKRHRGRVSGPSVAAFLILEPTFPRSARHAVSQARARLRSLCPPNIEGVPGERALRRLDTLAEALASRDAESIAAAHELATFLVSETTMVCTDVCQELFGYAPAGGAA
jgi:uncharacterized alpha-E superfamily protein